MSDGLTIEEIELMRERLLKVWHSHDLGGVLDRFEAFDDWEALIAAARQGIAASEADAQPTETLPLEYMQGWSSEERERGWRWIAKPEQSSWSDYGRYNPRYKKPAPTSDKPRNCTCHPDDNPPDPCAEKYAYSECVVAPLASLKERLRRWFIGTNSDLGEEAIAAITALEAENKRLRTDGAHEANGYEAVIAALQDKLGRAVKELELIPDMCEHGYTRDRIAATAHAAVIRARMEKS